MSKAWIDSELILNDLISFHLYSWYCANINKSFQIPITIRDGLSEKLWGGGGRSTKKHSCKEKLRENKNSCPVSSTEKTFLPKEKNIPAREMLTKKFVQL